MVDGDRHQTLLVLDDMAGTERLLAFGEPSWELRIVGVHTVEDGICGIESITGRPMDRIDVMLGHKNTSIDGCLNLHIR
jgi:hypothetical protein